MKQEKTELESLQERLISALDSPQPSIRKVKQLKRQIFKLERDAK